MKWLFVLILFLLFGGGVFMFNRARGIRNKNPGNIRHGDRWQGMAPVQTDESFVQFIDVKFGIRALNKILKTYSTVHGLNTVRGIIKRWAPPKNNKGKFENDTESYVLSVAEKLNVSPDQAINVQQYADALTTAIIKHENGLQPYTVAEIAQGVGEGWA